MKVNFEDIYEHIGFLFFAVASRAKGRLSPSALIKLTEIIEKEWRPVSGGDVALNMHLVDCIHAGVRYAMDNLTAPSSALESFRNYYTIHALPFGKALREKIISSALKIETEFSSRTQLNGSQHDLAELMHLKSAIA
jgi:hypothetical protein